MLSRPFSHFAMDASQTPANQRFDLNTGQEDIEDALSQAYKQGRISAGHILHTYLQWLKPEVCEFSYADWRVHNPVLEQVRDLGSISPQARLIPSFSSFSLLFAIYSFYSLLSSPC